MKALLEQIAKSICAHVDDIQITETDSDTTTVYEIKVHKDDQGKLIGKSGKTIQAIRTVVYSAAYKTQKRYNIEIVSL